MRIAIVKTSALGDIVNTMFVLQFIKNKYPLSEIDWIVEKKYKAVLDFNPHIDKIKTINLDKVKKEKSISLLVKELSKFKSFGNYDLVLDFQGLIKTAVISKLLKSKKVIGFDRVSAREGISSLAYNQKVNIGYDQNTILRNSKLLEGALNLKITGEEILKKKPYLFYESEVLLPQEPYIIFVIGSTWQSRNYPKEKFVNVANEIKKKCIVIWGNEQEKTWANWIGSKSKYVEVAPKLEIDDLKRLIDNSSLIIGNDTGPSHFAWALNIPSIILFGPTPTGRMYQTNVNKAIKSSSEINHYKLNKNDFSIKEISVNEIVKIAMQLL